jgi:HemY protein
MRFSLWALLALLLGAFAAHFLLQDRGYVLINFRSYVIEMSVPGLVLVLMAAYVGVRALVALARAPRRLGAAATTRRQRLSGGDLMGGLIHLTEGNWARGERLLTQRLAGSEAPLVNYLLAARAAQLQGASERRDQWLQLAFDESPDGQAAVLLTQADLQLQAGEHAAALATLQRLEQLRPDQPEALALLVRVYQALGDGPGLVALLPRLGRARLAPEVREQAALQALGIELDRPDLPIERVAELFAELPNDLRAAPPIAARRALALQRLGHGAEAERDLKAALKRNWHPALVHAYGEVRGADLAKQLKQTEVWLKAYPEDAALLLAAARLCMATELWGKARSYLESSLALAPAPEAYALSGQLLAELGEGELAAVAFRTGLVLVSPAATQRLGIPPSLAPPTGYGADREAS